MKKSLTLQRHRREREDEVFLLQSVTACFSDFPLSIFLDSISQFLGAIKIIHKVGCTVIELHKDNKQLKHEHQSIALVQWHNTIILYTFCVFKLTFIREEIYPLGKMYP